MLSGTATACIGAETFPVKAGGFLGYATAGLTHTLIDTGNEPLRCLVAGQRLAVHDVADYPDRDKRIYRNQNMNWDLADISAIDHPKAGRKI